ncbi:MAG: polysaccharide deacetylase family protein [Clostridia bacterium]|nr:polysaccharide deacetylase family protein [Clostridia bacterium]
MRDFLRRMFALFLAICGIFSVFTIKSAAVGVYRSVSLDPEKKQIALTFDDGPHPRLTLEILSILQEYGVKATFFMIGENARNYPEAARAVAAAGHEIGNHTEHHLHLSSLNEEGLLKELSACKNSIFSVCGVKPALFRPPEGAATQTVLRCAERFSYPVILWSIDTKDWEVKNAGKIADSVLSGIKPGAIILMHDYVGKNSKTPEALRRILPKLIEEGYEFVTVSELLGFG